MEKLMRWTISLAMAYVCSGRTSGSGIVDVPVLHCSVMRGRVTVF